MAHEQETNEIPSAVPHVVLLQGRNTYCIQDEYLGMLDARMDTLEKRRQELNRQLNELSLQLQGVSLSIQDVQEKVDDRVAKLTDPALHKHTNIVKKPTELQQEHLDLFKMAMSGTSQKILRLSYKLVLQSKAEKTYWRTDRGENVVEAYARRKKELEESAC